MLKVPRGYRRHAKCLAGAPECRAEAGVGRRVFSDMGNKHVTLDDILAEDMHHWYNKFMKESPSGLITLFELKSMLGLQGMCEDATGYVDQVFCTFDMDGVRTYYIPLISLYNLAEFLHSVMILLINYVITYSDELLDVNLESTIHYRITEQPFQHRLSNMVLNTNLADSDRLSIT